MSTIEILIVSWNVRDLLVRCLASIMAQTGAGLPDAGGIPFGEHRLCVHVVDNASTDGTVEMLQQDLAWVDILPSPTNLGFAAGNNLGLERTRGEYILLLNPDAELAPEAISVMLGALEAHPRAGIVGPHLTYPDGRDQPSRRRFPTFPMALFESTVLEQWFPGNRWARRYRMEDVPDDHVQRVDWLTGACLLTRRAVWEQIGPLDEQFFMYSEELDWCKRAAQAGWECLYVPEALVVHYEGQSSGQVEARRAYLFHTSKVLYWTKYHGSAAAEVLRCLLLLTLVLQLLEESVKWLLGHRRALRSERIAVYRWLLSTGLRRSSRFNGEIV